MSKKIQDINFDINTMCDFEMLTGKSLMSMLNDKDDLKMTDIRALIQAGLSLDDPKEAGTILFEYMQDEEQKPILDLISDKFMKSGMARKKKK